MSAEAKLKRKLLRPTNDTKFHIDFSWWDRAGRDLEVYLRSHLCEEHKESYAEVEAGAEVDSVDPETGEVVRVPGIQHTLISHCSQQDNYIMPQTTLVNAIFRLFLANGNTPLSSKELAERLDRPANMILRTLSGPRVYKGIRPYIEAD
ncbi:MAG: hypothetical protein ACLFWD_10400 [Anaerolineales bacterium]